MTDDASPENLRKFLESDDPAMVRMGISLAKGAGVPEELLPTILGLYMWDDDKNVRAAAKSVFNKHAPAEIQAKVKENWKPSYRTLSVIGDKFPEAIRPFLEAFKSQDAFAELALVPLIGMLSDDNWGVCRNAAGALRKLGWGPETDGQRTAYLIASMNWKSLVECGEPAVEPLIGVLSDGDRGVRRAAARALGEIGEPAMKPLINALGDEKNSVRWHAADALGAIGDTRAVEPLINTLGDDEGDVRYYAVEALGKIGGERVVEPLIGMLGDDKESVRRAAAMALGGIGDARAVKPLIKALRDDNGLVRWHTAVALGEIGDERAVEPLINALMDEDSVRKSALGALDKLGWVPETDGERAAYLIAIEDWTSLVVWGEPAVESLVKALAKHADERTYSSIRKAAAETLGEIGDARAVEPLINALGDSTSWVRRAAVAALEKIGDARAVEPLIEVLSDSAWWVRGVREAAVYALGEIGDERAVEPLIKALGDEEDNVRSADALKMFGVQGLQGFITAGKGNELTVSELKMILKEKKLPTSGTKALLIQRIMDAK